MRRDDVVALAVREAESDLVAAAALDVYEKDDEPDQRVRRVLARKEIVDAMKAG